MSNYKFITLNANNIDNEHICCAFTSKEAEDGYRLKKDWLKTEFENGYVFRRLDARAKVFIEYVPAEKAWLPVNAPNHFVINCFWVSGQYKGKGYAKALLQSVIDDAVTQGKSGIITVVGAKKFHFMSDGKWFIKQGFEIVEELSNGFRLLSMKLDRAAKDPSFSESAKEGVCPIKNGIVVYYSNRCPFTEYQVNTCLVNTAIERDIPLTIVKIETREQAISLPTPGTIFSLFYKGKFVTTDVSICMGARFDKIVKL